MIFARQPVPGRVKTRLIPALGETGACRLHLAMLEHIVGQVAALRGVTGQLWLTADGEAMDTGLGGGLAVYEQSGADLGARMARGFVSNFDNGYGPVLVCGADCPALSTAHLQQMLTHLQSEDAVISPALDGGYVALGLQRFDGALLADMPWGEDSVYQRTVATLDRLCWRWRGMDALPDIDHPADLTYLTAEMRQAVSDGSIVLPEMARSGKSGNGEEV